ncbi:C25 family cysteine peptidase [Larkinella insperata]|uniref:C25 family cysteine peptidase n=1 Tax=Larkinella insperata TaxID=332158 RepID=A0ABW3Q4T5_9BACT|nr:C25 family cysteine peptidase [Larkinella insperata]
MKRAILSSVFLLVIFKLFAQVNISGNEWINFEQTYYRIPVTQAGVYRLTTGDLQKAGVPLATINPTSLQLFRRGVELAVYVAGESDNKFDPEDYLEFIGERNDGQQDSLLYRPLGTQPHTYYSLYSDTAAYFLTWRLDGKPGKRMKVIADTDVGGLSPEPYHIAEQLTLLTSEISNNQANGGPSPFPTAHELYFEEGEGFTGPMLKKDSLVTHAFRLDGLVRAASVQPEMEMMLNGRDNTTHLVNVFAGKTASAQPLATVQFEWFKTARLSFKIPLTTVSTTNELVLTTQSQGSFDTDRYSFSYYRLRYPQEFDLRNLTRQTLNLLLNPKKRSYLELPNAPADPLLYDLTDPVNPRRLTAARQGNTLKLVVPDTETSRRIFVSAGAMTPARLERTVFRKINPARHNYLIVSHEVLMKPVGDVVNPVKEYAGYRASVAGGKYDTLVITTKELLNQFSYGERTPLAIRRFAAYMLTGKAASPDSTKYLLLIGRANAYYPNRTHPDQYFRDLVPTIGNVPGSDLLLTEGLAGFPENVPAIPTGRINTLNPQEILTYLAKVKEFEKTPVNQPWRKQVLHLSGGRSIPELSTFRRILDQPSQTAQQQYVGASITLKGKLTDEPVERIDVSGIVNSGVSLMTFFGHSSPIVTDLDFGYVSKPAYGYHNKGRYPLMFFNGCGVGNIFFGATNNLSTDWLLTADKGAIAILAHSGSGFSGPLETYTQQFYHTLFADSSFLNKSIGLVQQETTRRVLAAYNGPFDITNAQQMVLQGDPVLRMYPIQKPDFSLTSSGVFQTGTQKDSVRLGVVVINAGRFEASQRVGLVVRQRLVDGKTRSYGAKLHRAIAFRDTLYYAFNPDAKQDANTVATPNRFEIVVDPDTLIEEVDETNNVVVFDLKSAANGYTVVLPDSGQRYPPDRFNPLLDVTFDRQIIRNGALVSPNPAIQIILQDEDPYRIRQDTAGIEVYLKRPCESCALERVALSGPDVSWKPAGPDNRFVIDLMPRHLTDGLYTLQVHAADVSGNRVGPVPFEIEFRVKNGDSLSVVLPTPNPFSTVSRFRFTLSGQDTPGEGQIQIRNLKGQLVRTIRQGVRIGENSFLWDGTDQGGVHLPNGLYLFRLLLSDGREKSGRVVISR